MGLDPPGELGDARFFFGREIGVDVFFKHGGVSRKWLVGVVFKDIFQVYFEIWKGFMFNVRGCWMPLLSL